MIDMLHFITAPGADSRAVTAATRPRIAGALAVTSARRIRHS